MKVNKWPNYLYQKVLHEEKGIESAVYSNKGGSYDKKSFMLLITCCLALSLFSSCATLYPRVDSQGQPQYKYTYQVPEKTGDGWETDSLQSQGLNSGKIEALITGILTKRFENIHSIVLVKNGKLVLEEYFYGYNRNKQHMLRSATKSVTSILVGIAKDMNMIGRIDQKIQDFFPEYSNIDWQDPRSSITLKHVLTMSAGLDWNEWTYSDSDSRSSIYGMVQSNDWMKFVLQRKMVQLPGEKFNYSSGLSLALGGVLRNKTGVPANEFAEKYLFGPLGISDFSWQKGPKNMVFTSGGEKGLWLRPRDMAKIGLLMLQKGTWNGREIVSHGWVEESTRPHVNAFFAGSEYGYQWWCGEKVVGDSIINLFYAAGHGGQYIFVCPSLDLVAVFTSKVYGNPLGVVRPQVIMAEHILPAIVPLSVLEKKIGVEPESTHAFTGTYECSVPRVKLKIYKENTHLYCRVYFKKAKLTQLSKNQFSAAMKDIGTVRLTFSSDKDGRLDKVIAKIGFGILEFNR